MPHHFDRYQRRSPYGAARPWPPLVGYGHGRQWRRV